MSRKPLSAKNYDYGPPRPGNEVVKSKPRKRDPFPILNKSSLVAHINQLLKDTETSIAAMKQPLVEEELSNPTPESVQLIYFKLLNYCFDISPQSLTQAPFDHSGAVAHPELMEDFVYRIQFFRVMKYLMKTCLIDFHMSDLTSPDSKRLCRHLSAFINWAKFHHSVYMADEAMNQLKIRKHDLEDACMESEQQHRQLQHQVAELERQRTEEHELEEKHKETISAQQQQIQLLQREQEMLTQQYQSACEEKERSNQKLDQLVRELEKMNVRIEDLRKKVVTSPDKLKGQLSRLQQELSEVVDSTREMEAQQKMWEALASQAQQIPEGVIKALKENLELVTKKAVERNNLSVQYERAVEETRRQEHSLQEATLKLQSLQRHLKNVEEDLGKADLQEANKLSHARAIQELHRDIQLQQQEVRMKEVEDEQMARQVKEEERKIAEHRQLVQQASAETQEFVKSLRGVFHDKAAEYCSIVKSLGVELPQ